jgi:hypothetical protein
MFNTGFVLLSDPVSDLVNQPDFGRNGLRAAHQRGHQAEHFAAKRAQSCQGYLHGSCRIKYGTGLAKSE